ncbi:MAG: 1-acyl-sn-glycerol-3-phosphate acyltransferase [Crocinitomicaceae bacterium]|nr:1-acyl-sn-glycerol-3-phosphate acyltransferase [Crocinitomicaceae bacterium]
MRLFFGYLLTPVFYIFLGIFLLVFHPIQWLSYKLFGYRMHKTSVDVLNFFLTYSSLTLFNIPRVKNNFQLPKDRPIIFVSNHQSTYDIPGLIFFFRKYHGKFISKIELAKSKIPSIAFNLKHGGGANIDRKDSKQSKSEISMLAERMKKFKWAAFIFPEGTRSKNGRIKEFKSGGIITIASICPEALIVPIAIKGSYEMVKKGAFPLMPFNKMTWEVLSPIEINGRDINEVVLEAENSIRKVVEG